MYKHIVFISDIFLGSFLIEIHLDKLMHYDVSPNIYTHQLMSVDLIVQQLQYKYLYCHHQVLPLSLACRIMIHTTQNHH